MKLKRHSTVWWRSLAMAGFYSGPLFSHCCWVTIYTNYLTQSGCCHVFSTEKVLPWLSSSSFGLRSHLFCLSKRFIPVDSDENGETSRAFYESHYARITASHTRDARLVWARYHHGGQWAWHQVHYWPSTTSDFLIIKPKILHMLFVINN